MSRTRSTRSNISMGEDDRQDFYSRVICVHKENKRQVTTAEKIMQILQRALATSVRSSYMHCDEAILRGDAKEGATI